MGALYAWTVIEADGSEGTIATDIGIGLGMQPLVFHSKYTALAVRDIARAHGRATGRPVCLVEYSRRKEIERIEGVA